MFKRTFSAIFCTLCIFSTPTHSLTGGTAAVLSQFPSHVAINFPANVFCGGTILNVNHVLTAASCAFDANNNLVAASGTTIRSGLIILNDVLARTNVSRIYVHQNYNPYNLENNIAVLRTATNFNFPFVASPAIAPVVRNTRIVPATTQCQVAGWVPTTVNAPLQFLNVPVQTHAACNIATVHSGRVSERMYCVGLLTANTGVCPATTGAGLYCNGQLTGVLSSGLGCGIANSPGIYIQTRFYTDWIEAQFRRIDEPPVGPTPPPSTF